MATFTVTHGLITPQAGSDHRFTEQVEAPSREAAVAAVLYRLEQEVAVGDVYGAYVISVQGNKIWAAGGATSDED